MQDFDIKTYSHEKFQFLSGGGEMGKLIRAKDWSKTTVGPPGNWPQSLRTTLSIILNSKFPMFLWWGPELICFYNDAYRPSLGNNGKHPGILGMPAETAWPEIWDIIKPLIDQVLAGGDATWSEDQLIPIYRNGKLEDVYWTFSYSPVNDESGKPAGVFVTCNETTDKVITNKKLEESKDQLQFAIEAAGLGTWDYNPLTNRFTANDRLKEWFGLSAEIEIELHHATDAIAEKDRQRIIDVIQTMLDYASGGYSEEKFTIVHPVTKSERIVLVKGKASFNDDRIAWRLNGTLEDVTNDVIAQRKIEESERSLRLMIEKAPVAICVFRGDNHVVEIANDRMLELWGTTAEQVMNKPIFEGLPEAKGQGLEQVVAHVFATGERFEAIERPVNLPRNGKIETTYNNFVCEPLRNSDNNITGLMAIASEVTSQVMARKKIEEKEEQLRIALEGGELGTFDYFPSEGKLLWSTKTKELFGLPPDADVNIDLYMKALHPDDRNISQAIAQQKINLQNGGLYDLEYRTIGITDGRLRWVRSKGIAIYDANNNPVRYTGVVQEITKQKEAEQALKESEERFRTIADNISQLAWMANEKGQMVWFNKQWLEYSGTTMEQMLNEGAKNIHHPEHRSRVMDKYLKAVEDGTEWEDIFPLRGADGQYRWFLSRAITIKNADGKVKQWFGTNTDITQRMEAEKALKESEEKFRTMAESSDILIGVNDETVNAVYFNKAWEKLTGRNVEDLINLGWADLLHPEDRQPFLDKFFHAFENKESYDGEFRILNKEGTYSWLYAKVQVRLHPDGSYAGHISSCIDVTERKKAEEEIKRSEEALRKSEQRLRSLVESASFPIGVYTGREMRIELVNDSILNAWGRTRDVVGKLYADVLTELSGQGVYEQLDAVFTTGVPFHANNQYLELMVDGKLQPYYYNYSFTPLYDQAGKIYGILNTAANVTELNVAKIKLEESEQKLSLVIEASELGNWEVDLTTNEIAYSDRYLEIFGHAKGTVITRNDAAQQVHPDDRMTREQALQAAYKTGVLYYEARLLWPDNSIHWIEVKGKIFFDKDDNPVRLIGTIRDVTEEKLYQQELEESEQKFRLLADSMPQFIWTGDAKGNLNYFNKAVFKYAGLSENDVQNNGWIQIVHPDEREENIKRWMHSINTGEDFLFEHRFRRYDGEYRWQLSRAVPQRDETGKIQMWVGTSTDIQQMKEQDEQKDYFISLASHELKTPITSIKAYTQILQSSYSKSDDVFLTRSLNVIDKQVLKLTNLIADLLDVSKIKSGSLTLQRENFEINELIQEVIDEIKHINPEHDILFSKEESYMVSADKERIAQVLTNLLTNAIKYSPGSRKVKVESVSLNNHVTVNVQDYGIGINKNDQEKIFERFYRVEGNSEKTFPGFGIGLFISMEIVRRHNGEIGVRSEPGKGSVFYFSLPLIG